MVMAAAPCVSPESSPARPATLTRMSLAKPTHRLLATAIVAVATAAAGPMASAASITPLLDPSVTGGYTTNGYGISGDGSTILGRLTPTAGDQLAYVWRNNTATSLGTSTSAPNPFTNLRTSEAAKSDSTGGIIAGVQGNVFEVEAWVLDNGVQTVLRGPGSPDGSRLGGISTDGQTVTGYSRYGSSSTTTTGWTWTAAGGYTSVQGSDTEARGLSGDGSIVAGLVGTAAVRWINGGPAELLGELAPGRTATPDAVSQDGSTIVGTTSDFLAVSWSGLSITQLPLNTGFDYSFAVGVSGDGSRIVGGAGDNTNFDDRAVLWTPEDGMLDLNAYLPTLGVDLTGWQLDYAQGISYDGFKIVGDGTLNGVTTGFLVDITPVPEPSTVALAAISIAGAGLALRRRQLARRRSQAAAS